MRVSIVLACLGDVLLVEEFLQRIGNRDPIVISKIGSLLRSPDGTMTHLTRWHYDSSEYIL
jgi:hypothetical protein